MTAIGGADTARWRHDGADSVSTGSSGRSDRLAGWRPGPAGSGRHEREDCRSGRGCLMDLPTEPGTVSQLAQTHPAPPVVHLLGPAAMATRDICNNRPGLKAFCGNLCLKVSAVPNTRVRDVR